MSAMLDKECAQFDTYQHCSLGNITGLSFLLRYRLHVIPVCRHCGVGGRRVDSDHLDTLVLEELHSQVTDC